MITLDLTNIEDLQTYKMWDTLAIMFDELAKFSEQGDGIMIERRYFNSKPDIVQIISTPEELENYKTKIFGNRE